MGDDCMSYREEFVKKVGKIFEAETAAYRRKEKAYEFITEYFGDLLDDLFDETEAVEEELEIEYEKLRLKGRELKVKFGKGFIEIYTTDGKSGEKKTVDILEDDGNNFMSKKFGIPLGEEILDQYLEAAFAETIGQ
jgi:hypothetical protein